MNAPPERFAVVRQWIATAEEDYLNFENTLKMDEDCPLGTVCFHAQQCVEKYLKARLAYLSIPFPKTHDIGELVKLLPPGMGVALSILDREKLTGYAWKGRYPGDAEPISRQKAEEAAALAIKIRKAIRAGFPKGILVPGPDIEGPYFSRESPAAYRAGPSTRAKRRKAGRGKRGKG